MSSSKHKNFLIFLAIISFLADLVTLGHFLFTKKILNFFSYQWFMGFAFVIFLAIAGFVLLKVADSDDASEIIMSIYGCLFLFLTIPTYIFFGYKQIFQSNSFSDYLGFIIVLLIFEIVGVIGINLDNEDLLPDASYIFAVMSMIMAFMLTYKYVFLGKSFDIGVLLGELLILAIGVISFFVLFYRDEW